MTSDQRPDHLKKLFDSLDEEDPYMDFLRKQIEEEKLNKMKRKKDEGVTKKSKNAFDVKKGKKPASKTSDENIGGKTRKKMKKEDGMQADESSRNQSKISLKKKPEPKTVRKRTSPPSGDGAVGEIGRKIKTDDKVDAVDPSSENRLKEIFGNSLDEPDAYCVGIRASIHAEKKEAAKKRKTKTKKTEKVKGNQRKVQSSSTSKKSAEVKGEKKGTSGSPKTATGKI